MKLLKITCCLLSIALVACNHPKNDTGAKTEKAYGKLLPKLEQQAAEKSADNLGDLLYSVEFQVKTTDLDNYKEGFIPWIGLEHPEKELPNLIDKDRIAISEPTVTVIIDYPLTHEYRFMLVSKNGFTREQLVKEVSKHYHKLYQEEENTATIKTIPIKERKTMYNRNQTDGKYGVWGHDIADLVLDGIDVYKSLGGNIILSLNIES